MCDVFLVIFHHKKSCSWVSFLFSVLFSLFFENIFTPLCFSFWPIKIKSNFFFRVGIKSCSFHFLVRWDCSKEFSSTTTKYWHWTSLVHFFFVFLGFIFTDFRICTLQIPKMPKTNPIFYRKNLHTPAEFLKPIFFKI